MEEPTRAPARGALLTPNQLVAYNLWATRKRLGLTQAEAAERLEPYLGVRWSKATFSAAERSWASSSRVRQFTADDIAAFARAFDVPALSFFMPVDSQPATAVLVGPEDAPSEAVALSPVEFLQLLVGRPGADGVLTIDHTIESLLSEAEQVTAEQEALRGYAQRVEAQALHGAFTDLPSAATSLRELARLLERAKELVDDAPQRRVIEEDGL